MMSEDEGSRLDDLVGSEAPGDRVHLVLPPSSEFLRTVRLVAADAAVRAGGDVDEVEDFRIAIDELSHLLMTATDHPVHVSMASLAGHVVARGSARARGGNTVVDLDELSWMIVSATTDEHRVERRGNEVSFEVVKHLRTPEHQRGDGPLVRSP